jgi:hypothetical protein
MAANRSLRAIRSATITFYANIVKPWLAGPLSDGERRPPDPPGEKMLTAQAPVGHARYPALGAGSGKSGAVTSRALYVNPDPAPFSAAANFGTLTPLGAIAALDAADLAPDAERSPRQRAERQIRVCLCVMSTEMGS